MVETAKMAPKLLAKLDSRWRRARSFLAKRLYYWIQLFIATRGALGGGLSSILANDDVAVYFSIFTLLTSC